MIKVWVLMLVTLAAIALYLFSLEGYSLHLRHFGLSGALEQPVSALPGTTLRIAPTVNMSSRPPSLVNTLGSMQKSFRGAAPSRSSLIQMPQAPAEPALTKAPEPTAPGSEGNIEVASSEPQLLEVRSVAQNPQRTRPQKTGGSESRGPLPPRRPPRPGDNEDDEPAAAAATAAVSTSALSCTDPRMIRFWNNKRRRMERPACQFPLKKEHVIVGVSVSKATIDRAHLIENTWLRGAGVSHAFLGFEPSPGLDVLVTGVARDDYWSTMGKGFLGLDKMIQRYPQAKWYGLMDDDTFVFGSNLAYALSAFNPDEPWCFSQAGFSNHEWRLYGGAGIIVSRGMAVKLVPGLRQFYAKSERRIMSPAFGKMKKLPFLLDIALPNFIKSRGFTFHNLDGMFSQAPGFYFGSTADHSIESSTKELPLTFHYIQGPYMRHLSYFAQRYKICAPRAGSGKVAVAIGVADETGLDSEYKVSEVQQTWGPAVLKDSNMQLHVVGGTKCIARSFASLYQAAPSSQWYMLLRSSKAYLVVENLRWFLSTQDPASLSAFAHVNTDGGKDASPEIDFAHPLVLSGATMEALAKSVPSLGDGVTVSSAALTSVLRSAGVTMKHVPEFLKSTIASEVPECAITVPVEQKELFDAVGKKKPTLRAFELKGRIQAYDYLTHARYARGR